MAMTLALLMSGASAKITISSGAGWHLSYKNAAIPGSTKYIEWRQFNQSWFQCEMGFLFDPADGQCPDGIPGAHDRWCTEWDNHTLSASSGGKFFYTMKHTGYNNDEFLVYAWNTSTGITDVRVCLPRSRDNALFSCAKTVDHTDCPESCFERQGGLFGDCVLKYHDESCTSDVRCVPAEAHDPSASALHQLKVEGNRCLAAYGGDLKTETCDAASPSQRWTFAEVSRAADAMLV
jgi:hypothetical protein